MNLERIEQKIDKVAAGSTEVSISVGGVKFQNMVEVMEAAKLLSLSGPAVPKWLQGNPGGCWSIIMQAIEWGFSPISVAKMSYEVNGVVGYMSQLVHAVIETRAPLKGRLRCNYEGEGANRVCIVTGHVKDEIDPLVYRSPVIGNIKPKNSPLWATDPDQQLWFYSSRAWCRRYFPDCLLGIYAKDELEDSHIGADRAKDVTPKPSIAERLKGSTGKRGFSSDHVERETGGAKAIEHAVTPTVQTVETVVAVPVEVRAASIEPQGASHSAEAADHAHETWEQASASHGQPEPQGDGSEPEPPAEVAEISLIEQFTAAIRHCATDKAVMQVSREWAPKIDAAGDEVKQQARKVRTERLAKLDEAIASLEAGE